MGPRANSTRISSIIPSYGKIKPPGTASTSTLFPSPGPHFTTTVAPTTSCSRILLDTQGRITYKLPPKKELLITHRIELVQNNEIEL